MEIIPLRAYNREIEQLIDNDRSQEALQHCQRILDQYPRCLDTFRLMGKAYLELRQFDKAEDIFQKVLSFVPDDFTANLGMSLLREKQTNLEGTIWHMERSYEAQPSNTAVQDELRRLYKQRDGIESPRIRLTRGALVRMYIRGDLIPQAINEIQSILNEDPSRMDIKILQAEALLKSGKKEESLQICHEILKNLPYCFVANRLLFENRSSSIKIEEAQTIQERLRELDPYYEFTSPEQPDPALVPEGDVKIEIPEGFGTKTATANPSQNQSFSAFDIFSQTSSSGIVDQTIGQQKEDGNTIKSEEKIPSWMKDVQTPSFLPVEENSNTGAPSGEMPSTPNIGFDSGKNMTTEEPISHTEFPKENSSFPIPVPEESLPPANPFLPVGGDAIPSAEPGDIPEWLKALASEPPAASSDAVTSPLRVPGETGVLQTGEENLDFLRNLPGETGESKPAEVQPDTPPTNPAKSLYDILPPSPFLTSSESTQPVPIEDGGETFQPPSRELPDWLRSAAEPTVEKPEPAVADFRQDFIPESQPSVEPQNGSFAIENQYQAPDPENIITAPVSNDEIPTPEIEQYLEQLRKDITPGDQPEWLKKENLGNELEALFEDSKKPVIPATEPESTSPDWMSQLKQEEVTPSSQPAASQTPTSVPNVPDWLFTPEDTEGETAPIQSDTPVTHQPPPDWLAAARPDIFSRDFDQSETGKESIEEPKSAKEETGVSEAMDFSASLAQPSAFEPESTKPEQEEIVLPDLDFLQSQPIDFMNADREPLEDNLVGTNQLPVSNETLDFSKAVPAESLPADLAALLREDSVNEITTNPLEVEPVPELSFDFNTSELIQKEPEIGIQPETSQPESIQIGEIPLSEKPEVGIPFFELSEEARQFEADAKLGESLIPPEHPSQPEEEIFTKSEQLVQPEATLPVESASIPAQAEIISPFAESFAETELPPQIDIPTQPVTAFEQLEEMVQPESEVKPAETIPEAFEIPKIKFEPAIPDQSSPVETVSTDEQSIPPDIFVTKPKASSIEEKPITSTPKVAKPVRSPAAPRPVRRTEQPASTQPVIQRKNSGSADLNRAREAFSHGDISTALRRYIKLINSNKALEFVSNDLKDLVRKNPKNYLAWQTFGDARLRSNRIQEALDAYAKAAELLK